MESIGGSGSGVENTTHGRIKKNNNFIHKILSKLFSVKKQKKKEKERKNKETN